MVISANGASPAPGVLDGVRVVDMATVLAGPGAARYLADYGADVIKVERPGGDATRKMGWTVPGEEDSLIWKLSNRGKRAISLDLRASDGLAEMLRLLDTADIFVENMRPGKLEDLGLGPEVLWQTNPRLVILRVSGFGQDGPYAQRPGFATIAEALSGFSGLLGEPDGGPLLPPIALTDEVTALVGAFSVMLALRHAERTGQGQVADVNLLESMLQIMGPLPSAWLQMRYLQPRLGSGIPYTVPRGTYQCSDGVWVAMSASSETVAGRLLELMGLRGDTRFTGFRDRFENREQLEKLTRAWVASRPSARVLKEVEAVDAAIAPVYSMADVVKDDHLLARNSIIDIDGMAMQNVVARLSKTPGRIRSVGPLLNEHGDELHTELAARKVADHE
jgi:crotonobetainyl-CoA:carnitine CoA-transferase CaiB-like acyl-CoA transferase